MNLASGDTQLVGLQNILPFCLCVPVQRDTTYLQGDTVPRFGPHSKRGAIGLGTKRGKTTSGCPEILSTFVFLDIVDFWRWRRTGRKPPLPSPDGNSGFIHGGRRRPPSPYMVCGSKGPSQGSPSPSPSPIRG